MSPLRLPAILLIAFVTFFVSRSAVAQAQPQGDPQPNSTVAPSAPPSGGQSDEADTQPGIKPTGAPDSVPTGDQQAPQDEQGKSQSGQSEAGSEAQEPTSTVLITIDKTKQQMTVSVDGSEQYNWPVSTGRGGYSTPSGAFTPISMNAAWYSREWDDAPMPHAIFFLKDGHAIHGSYEVKTLGKAVSHGCVRIAPKNATILYALVKEKGIKNTQIVLTGTTPGGEWKSAHPRYRDTAPWFAPGRGYYPAPMGGFFGGWFRPYGR